MNRFVSNKGEKIYITREKYFPNNNQVWEMQSIIRLSWQTHTWTLWLWHTQKRPVSSKIFTFLLLLLLSCAILVQSGNKGGSQVHYSTYLFVGKSVLPFWCLAHETPVYIQIINTYGQIGIPASDQLPQPFLFIPANDHGHGRWALVLGACFFWFWLTTAWWHLKI